PKHAHSRRFESSPRYWKSLQASHFRLACFVILCSDGDMAETVLDLLAFRLRISRIREAAISPGAPIADPVINAKGVLPPQQECEEQHFEGADHQEVDQERERIISNLVTLDQKEAVAR